MSTQDMQVLFEGPEGVVTGSGPDEAIIFCLDLGGGTRDGELYPDGDIVFSRPRTLRAGSIVLHQSEMVTMTPEEAEPYKAFLRSKGVTLPHVMS